MLLPRPTLGGAWPPMTRWCQVTYPGPRSEGPREDGIRKGREASAQLQRCLLHLGIPQEAEQGQLDGELHTGTL